MATEPARGHMWGHSEQTHGTILSIPTKLKIHRTLKASWKANLKLYTKKRRTCSKSQKSVGILVQRWFKDFKIDEALLIIMAPKFGKAAPKTGKAAAKKSGAPEPAATMHIQVPKGSAKASQQTPSRTIADFFKPKPPPPAKANQTNSFQQCMLGTFAQPIDRN